MLTGTKTSDTECKNCSFGFYSSSGLNCTKWTEYVKCYYGLFEFLLWIITITIIDYYCHFS